MKAIVCSLLDSVMVLASGGWTNVELELVQTPQGLRVTSLQAKGTGTRAPKPLPKLGIEREHEALRLSDAFQELSDVLSDEGKHWHGGKATFERSAGFADLKLLGGGDKIVWFMRLEGQELDVLLFTDALFDALSGSEPAFELLQSSLKVTESSPMLELGRYTPEEFVWKWNQADERIRRITAVAAHPAGLSALWREWYACEEGFAWALCSHVCVALGARGLARVEAGSDVKLCAVLSPS